MVLLLLFAAILIYCSEYAEPYRPYIIAAVAVYLVCLCIKWVKERIKERKAETARQNAAEALNEAQLAILNFQTATQKLSERPDAPGAISCFEESGKECAEAIGKVTDAMNEFSKRQNDCR